MTGIDSGRANPLDEIRRVERSTAMAIEAASAAAAGAVRDARARGRALVEEARQRGERAALQRYDEGMRRARDDAQQILAGADDRVAALRARVAPSLDAAVEGLLALVLPDLGEG